MSALYAWLRRHPRLVDGVLAAVLSVGGVAYAVSFHRPAALPVTFGLTIPVIFRREHPVGAFAIAVAAGALQVLTLLRPIPPDLAIVVLLYTLAAYAPRRSSVPGLAVCVLGSVIEAAVLHPRPARVAGLHWLATGSILFAGPALIAWLLGDSMRYRRAYYANLEERAATLERERDSQAQIAAAAERARIARELHDVVAHNVSVMVVQADGAAYAIDADPARAREALAAISATGRKALTEMRVLLGVLRRTSTGQEAGADAEAALAPLPGLNQLGALIDQARAAGLPVTCMVDGDPRPLPEGAALAAYRIVQESLTNVRKHAGGRASANVLVRYRPDAVEIEVSDDGLGGSVRPDGSGHGLTGMRERAAMYGGSVRAGPLPGGGFSVTALLPVAAPRADAQQPGAAQAGAPQAGAPQAGAPQAGAPQAGAPQAGAPQAGVA